MAFEPDELAVLSLASRVWQQATLAGPAARALLKLKAAGVDSDEAAVAGVEPRVGTSEPAFAGLYAAVRDRAAGHLPLPRRPRRRVVDAAAGALGHRLLARPLVRRRPRPGPGGDPGLPALPGRRAGAAPWAARARSRCPPGSTSAGRSPCSPGTSRADEATLYVRPGAGVGLRRRATRESPGAAPGDWDEVVVDFGDPESLAAEIAGYGPDVVAADPATVRDAVVRRLTAVARRPPHEPRPAPGHDPAAATERLSRLLAMVPYLVTRQGIPLAEAAREVGITEEELVKDLELLFVCGTPGHMPDDLIDAEWDDGHVYLRNADTIARPLRLGIDEALALIVGLRALSEVPGRARPRRARAHMAKLEAAAGDAAPDQRAGQRRGRGRGRGAGRRPARARGRPAAAPDLLRADPRRDDRA